MRNFKKISLLLLTTRDFYGIIYAVGVIAGRKICGRGGIGRRARFRIRREAVLVQVLSPVPMCGGIAQLGERLYGIQ